MINKDYVKKRSGCSFRGYILCDYKTLIKTFGKPTSDGDGYKIDAEWLVNTPHGPAIIYNYKNGKSYLKEDGLDLCQIFEWHIGAKNKQAYQYINSLIKNRLIEDF